MKPIPLFSVFMAPEVIEELKEVLYSGYIGQGQKVNDFEIMAMQLIGNPFVLSLYSGTAALNLALRLADVKGKAVITSPVTCSATNMPILENGAKIVWADIDEGTGNISPESIEERIKEIRWPIDIGAIMIMDWGGRPCDYDKINKIALEYNIPVIEDACHALGAVYKGQYVGTHSDFTCFSLQAIKTITSVDGGLLFMKKKEDYDRGKLLRWYGIDRENPSGSDLRCEDDILEYGYKYHMNDVNATIGMCNFKYLEQILWKTRNNAVYYNQQLKDIPGITLLRPEGLNSESSYWLYTMKVENRDGFMKWMAENKIMTSKVHARNDFHTCFKEFKRDLPGVDNFVKQMICLPVGYHVEKEDRERIVSVIREGW